jgi:hypothetical protein
LVLAAAAALACSGEVQTPEDRVRAVLAALEAAAEARDVGAMKESVSESYRDASGRDKRAAAGLVAMHFLQNRSVYLLTRIDEVTLTGAGDARASVLVAMAGTPIPSPEALPAMRADFYHFAFALREEDGAFRVTSAAWRPASLDDFR